MEPEFDDTVYRGSLKPSDSSPPPDVLLAYLLVPYEPTLASGSSLG
jgi:hypothetical protein